MARKKIIKLLDLCCKAGGAARGYELAALEIGYKIQITGIDIEPQPNYPYKFIRADAVEYFLKNWHKYTHYHASPPCQAFTKSTSQAKKNGKIYPDIIQPIREIMENNNLTGVIENVPSAVPTFAKNTVRETWAFAMGIDWYMKDTELAEAIPPAFTHYIGREYFKN